MKAEELRDSILDGVGEMLRGVEDRIVDRVLAEIRAGNVARKPKHGLKPEHRELLAALIAKMDTQMSFALEEVFSNADVDDRLTEALTACKADSPYALGAILRELRRCDLEGVVIIRDEKKRTWTLRT